LVASDDAPVLLGIYRRLIVLEYITEVLGECICGDSIHPVVNISHYPPMRLTSSFIFRLEDKQS
jgi:hypothetical protein